MGALRVLFLVNGLGLGNSTRCHAIMQRLIEDGAEINVVTSGNGVWYFRSAPGIVAVHKMESLYYGVKDGRISIARTMLAAVDFLRILRRNAQKLIAIVEDWRPDIAVIDSVYTFAPLKRRKVPIVALNNADVVHLSYRRFADRPKSIRAQFWCVEESDYLFHRIVPDVVISPNLDPSLPEVGGNVRRVGPIVRRGYKPRPARSRVSKVLIMLSGSRFGSPVRFNRTDWPFEIDVVGRPPPENWSNDGKIRFHGKVLDNRALLEDADLVVVNGGFSAVSESFSMQKPLVVVPVPNHAEQWVNARTIEHLCVGTRGDETHLEDALGATVDSASGFNGAYRQLGEIPDGAAQAAKIITTLAGGWR
jgi:UDP:flavonoid glycosyltransferase YjiC (YdhE family)